MTVENTQNKMPPLQMGTTNEYPFTFAVLLQDPTEEEALEAIKASVLQADGTEIELVYNTDYTVTLNTDRIGGTLTVNDIRTSSDYITIYRQYEQTQEVDYKDFNSAPAETFEQCFDKLTMLSQQQQEEINRSLKLNVSSTIIDPSLPEPIANNTLIWDSVGSSLKNYDIIGENNLFKAEVNAAIAAGQADIQAQFDEFENVINNEIEDVREAAEKINELEQAVDDAQTAANSAEASASNASQAAISATQAAQQTQADIQEIEEKIEEVGGMLSLEIGDIGFTQMAIDESKGKRRALKKVDNIIIQEQYPELTKKIKATQALDPDLFCTESEWQAELAASPNGVCYKYVIDNEAGTIRLPKYPEYLDLSINGAKTVSVYGDGKALGLTDGSTNYGVVSINPSSNQWMLGLGTNSYGQAYGTSGNVSSSTLKAARFGVVKDASKSGLTGSVTTSSEQIKGTYFIQVATGAETEDNIVNEIELNNPFSLLDYKYSEYELNNLSWLRSQGQYNSKAVYPAVYDLLLKIYNGVETKAGVSVKLTTETFTDYDFVLNTAEETFRLPLLNGSEDLTGNKVDNLTLEASGTTYIAPANGWYTLSKGTGTANYYISIVNQTSGLGFNSSSGGTANTQIISCPVKKGDEVIVSYNVTGATEGFKFCYAQGNGSLYFYVGETVQNANLVNLGRIQETMVTRPMVDGQWVNYQYEITQNVACPTSDITYDLSTVLPNDGYNYEIFIDVYGYTGTTSGNTSVISVTTDFYGSNGFNVVKNTTRYNARVQFSSCFNAVIGLGRTITFLKLSSNTGTFTCCLRAYRRIGTNL